LAAVVALGTYAELRDETWQAKRRKLRARLMPGGPPRRVRYLVAERILLWNIL